MKKSNLVYALTLALAVVSIPLPLFAADDVVEEKAVEETGSSNSSKMKQGAKDFFNGLKGTVKDGANSAKEKAKTLTQEAYVGEWYFSNGKYSTMITLENDWDFKITQTTKKGENVWTGSYEEGNEKKQLILHLVTANGKTSYKDWNLSYIAEKKDYIIVRCEDLSKDPNGYDFSNRTLFSYVGN